MQINVLQDATRFGWAMRNATQLASTKHVDTTKAIAKSVHQDADPTESATESVTALV